MLDINRIRECPEEVSNALKKRGVKVDFTQLLSWDAKRRELIFTTETMQAEKNKLSGQVPDLRKQGRDISELLAEMKQNAERIKDNQEEIRRLENDIKGMLELLPNLPADDVQAGDASQNLVIRTWGTQLLCSHPIRDHMDLCSSLGLLDYSGGVKMGGNGFWLYKGKGAVMEWALLSYFIQAHLEDGYQFLLPPHILTYHCGYTAGQFPKFEQDVFWLEREEGKGYRQFLLPTSETALINYHRDEILEEESLPRKYFSCTPCYRKEAGSYRSEERGMIRGHQFNKVELFQYTRPEDSDAALEELVGKAENLMKGLGLHYRVSRLAAGDCGHAMAKTYDIEVWIPSMGLYKEVSSVSNAHDYQARRGNIRFRRKNGLKNEFLHTLNASGLATSRLMPAIVEQFQQEGGRVAVPRVLKPWIREEILERSD